MATAKLSESDIQQRLRELPKWSIANGKLHREYKFATFVDAWRFMSGAALHAETLNHHPEWCNVYNKVVVDLTTHDAGGISAKDFELAARMEALART